MFKVSVAIVDASTQTLAKGGNLLKKTTPMKT